MKMTMHIDEALLKRVIDAYGYESKTEAVEKALREMDRKARYREFVRDGLGLTEEEMADAVAPGYDPKALNVSGYAAAGSSAKDGAKMVAEDPSPYGD